MSLFHLQVGKGGSAPANVQNFGKSLQQQKKDEQ